MLSWWGCAFAALSILGFGSNFVVVKAYKTGDGAFFAFVLANGILFVGVVTQLLQCRAQCPTFQPLAMLGGVLWSSGNLFTVPIIKTIGLSMGMLSWGTVSLLTGWASARFGLLGLERQPVSSPALNSTGVVFATLALAVFAFIQPSVRPPSSRSEKAVDDDDTGSDEGSLMVEVSWTDQLSSRGRTAFGFSAAAIAGVLYGANFNPPGYVRDHAADFHGATSDLKDLIFSHFVGIWLATTFYFACYCVIMRNKPIIHAEVALPGIISGVIWACAQVSCFYALDDLSNVIAFPILAVGPGLVSAAWSIFVFRELEGRRNFLLVALAFALSSVAASLMALSK